MSPVTLVLSLLIIHSACYLELPLFRVPHHTKQIPFQILTCPTITQNTTIQNTQVCYLKDINYAVELYHKDLLHMLAVDFTAPISWIKHPDECMTTGQLPCGRIDVPLSEKIKKKFSRSKGKNKQPAQEANQEKMTIEAMEPITGILEKSEGIEFWTKDYGKFFSIYKVLLIGLFLTDEKQRIFLNHTNFLNATRITQHTAQLADGALSFRFDDESEKSFLDELFGFVGEKDRYVTVFLGKENPVITIGDLSVKNSETGYSGIEWMGLDKARYPVVGSILVQIPDAEKPKEAESESQAIFTLSASYISFPQKDLKNLITLLDAGCKIDSTDGYLQCTSKLKQLPSKKIILDMGDISVSLQVSELVRKSSRKAVGLNIRQSLSNYTILGEPVMQKYLTVFDYAKNRIGLAPKRVTLIEQLIDVITLIRFIVFVFGSGCLFLLCYRPVRRTLKTIRLYRQLQQNNNMERTGLRYQGVQENSGYDELQGRLKEMVSDGIQNL